MTTRIYRALVIGAVGIILIMTFIVWLILPPQFAAKPTLITTLIGPSRVRPQIAFTSGHMAILAPDGSLWDWGTDRFSQQGEATFAAFMSPIPEGWGTPHRWPAKRCQCMGLGPGWADHQLLH